MNGRMEQSEAQVMVGQCIHLKRVTACIKYTHHVQQQTPTVPIVVHFCLAWVSNRTGWQKSTVAADVVYDVQAS